MRQQGGVRKRVSAISLMAPLVKRRKYKYFKYLFKYHSSFSKEHSDKPDQYVLNFFPSSFVVLQSLQIATEKHGDIKISLLPGESSALLTQRLQHPGPSSSVYPDQKAALRGWGSSLTISGFLVAVCQFHFRSCLLGVCSLAR